MKELILTEADRTKEEERVVQKALKEQGSHLYSSETTHKQLQPPLRSYY